MDSCCKDGQYERKLNRLRSKHDDQLQEIEELQQQKETKQQEFDVILTKKKNEHKSKIDELNQEITAKKTENEALKQKEVNLESKQNEYLQEIEVLKQQIAEKTKENEALKRDKEQQNHESLRLNKEIERLKYELSLSQKEKEIITLKHKNKNVKNKSLISKKHREIDQLKNKISCLKVELTMPPSRTEEEKRSAINDNMDYKNENYVNETSPLLSNDMMEVEIQADDGTVDEDGLNDGGVNIIDVNNKAIQLVSSVEDLTEYLTTNWPLEALIFPIYASITSLLIATAFNGSLECDISDKIISLFTFCAFLLISPIHRIFAWFYFEEGKDKHACRLIVDVMLRMLVLSMLMLLATLKPFSCWVSDTNTFKIGVIVIGMVFCVIHKLINTALNEENSDCENFDNGK